jgi:hypothetical protein
VELVFDRILGCREWHTPERFRTWGGHEKEEQEKGAIWSALLKLPLANALDETESEIAQEFHNLAETWKGETAHISSMSQIVMHPSYQKIIKMGWDVVPLLLKDLQETKSFWFWALTSITEENPIGPNDAGNVLKMTDAWIRWGRGRGLT